MSVHRPYQSTQQGSSTPVNNENSSETGEFRCRTCLRGPPLTKKYAKNQCQTCYKKEKRIQKEDQEMMQQQ